MIPRKAHALLALVCLVALACGAAPPPPAPPPALQAAAPAPEAAPPDDDPGPVPVGPADPSWGSADALVTLVEFGDFQCPYTARAVATIAQLERAYGPERLRVVWKNNPLPFHPHARPAAALAATIHARLGADAFWRTHDTFFADQAHLGDLVAAAAARAGIAPGHEEQGEAKVDEDIALTKHLGATGTPAFFLNGVFISGAQPYEKFAGVVDDQIKKAQALLDQGTPRGHLYTALARAQWAPPPPPAPAKPPPEDRTIHGLPVGRSPVRGKPGAPVTIVEIAEFQCPFCGRAEPTLAQITARYGDKVRLVWKHNPLPFHPRAEPAAELALEARAQKGDKAFWAAHDLMLLKACAGDPTATDRATCEGRGRTWADNQTRLGDPELLDDARTLGLDVARVKAAIAGHKHLAEIEEDQDLADDVGAGGTPTFFINGRILVGAQPFERFQAIIDEELPKAEALIQGGIPAAQVYDRILTAAVPPRAPEKKTVPPPTRDNPSRGPAGAKVVIQFFSDFECPFCKRVAPTIADLEKAFPGKIRVVWRNRPLPMHANARPAAEAAMEAFHQKGAGGFWAMYALLYAASGAPDALSRPALDGYAKQVGLDPAKFAAALDTHTGQALIDADGAVASAAGINGTPAFVINGYFVSGAQPLAKFKKIVQRALKEASGPAGRP